ncbi:nucleotide exchange factor GrpE [Candidatus Roizmanbacteria bacterium CG22_combo_CG10-13_8_21_14_all_35_9]|uniref:Protein GrpE n=1 Tax=Candidatus Roizmanbacteria bacterium CG22_combo_CG10-13_8_21_14_all_35_9 TaxID=1974861 RepID=A0A2H0BWY8_9BACT|nr:MAG: nucleotide exchange factor GrpE [Candidatus Roizmanbacteria bacterium CG22_combo_CG10-13_8_21_14_all_35_9]
MDKKKKEMKKPACPAGGLEIDKLTKEVNEWKNKYLRALADYQNLEKRFLGEKEEIIKSANFQLIIKLLPFLDSLDKAEVFIKDQGLKIAKENLLRMLQETGLKEIEVLDKEFDPNLAEAVDIVAGEKDDVVIEVLRKGYQMNGRILRVAQVKVTKKIIKS